MSKLSSWKTLFLLFIFCAAAAIGSPAQTFKSLVSFDYADGAYPFLTLAQGTDGNLYGPTNKGGPGPFDDCTDSCGIVFKITPAGTLTTAHNFVGTDGNGPSGLVLGTDGNFYGTASYGGAYDCTSYGSTGTCGTIFKMTLQGTVTVLHNFCSKKNCTDGAIPWGGLVQGTDGNFYGTTVAGGTGTCKGDLGPGCGTVFKITPGGALTTLHSFDDTDGAYPYGGVVQATNGNFYGTTSDGGDSGYGTVFQIALGGALTTLRSFDGADGAYPSSWLVQAANGSLYGTTAGPPFNGGPSCKRTGVGWGTVFEITVGGVLTTLHSFDDSDGAYPYAGLSQATDGNFYGTTTCGGANGEGTVFKITSGGKLTTLHTFDGSEGAYPYAAPAQATNGTLYGTTLKGGADDYGTVFSLALGLGPFVETNPTSGKVGTAVTILGNNLTGATSVTFNGKAATFKAVSSTEITTTVPTGATTGKVSVKTPSRTLTSNVNFRVP
jgi:uncharacterized repeat protein (TIGR03803 family)